MHLPDITPEEPNRSRTNSSIAKERLRRALRKLHPATASMVSNSLPYPLQEALVLTRRLTNLWGLLTPDEIIFPPTREINTRGHSGKSVHRRYCAARHLTRAFEPRVTKNLCPRPALEYGSPAFPFNLLKLKAYPARITL
jgi:hypothetical protein